MIPAKLTLEAIDREEESSQEDGFRNHLGASVIGKPCQREVWYDYRWSIRERFKGQQLRLFKTGHFYEARFVSYLRSTGATVFEFDPKLPLKEGKPQQFRVTTHDGHFGGSLDGIALNLPDLANGRACSVSFKTHNEKSFTKLLEMGVMGSKFEHFVQEQVYMHLLPKSWKVDICLYLAVNKNTDSLHAEFINYDKEVASTAIARGGNVIYSNVPLERIGKNPAAYGCKYCQYNRLCHFGDVQPEMNCRTCRFSRVGHNGNWICGLRSLELNQEAQKAGCASYQVNPMLQGVQP